MLTYGEQSYLAAKNEIEATGKDAFEFDDLLDYAGATALDIGVTLVQSLAEFGTLGYAETDKWKGTGEILHAINEDAGRYYDQNKDLVQLSSFIGGMFIPGMAAYKTIKWAKGGRTWIGGLERTIKASEHKALAELKKLGVSSAEYNAARRSMRISTLKSGVAEGLVYELEFAAMMNKHDYLDNDYDIIDFSVGAALGGLVAPIRLIQQTKKFKELERTVAEAQVAPGVMTLPLSLQGADAGQTLSYRANMYNIHLADDVSGLSLEMQNVHKIATSEHINGMAYQVNKMAYGDRGITTRINFTLDKGQALAFRNYNKAEAYDMFPDELIGGMAKRDPSVLAGVEKAVTYNAETVMQATLDTIVKVGDNGAINVASGQVARNTLFSNFTQNFSRSYDDVVAAAPSGIEIVEGGLHISGELDTNMRRWMAEYFSLPSNRKVPVAITGAGDKFTASISKAATVREAAMNELAAARTHNVFVPQAQMIDDLALDVSSAAAIADPYYGMRLLSETDALAGAGVNAYPGLIVNKNVNMASKLGMKPFEQSVAMSDKAYQEAMIAVEKLPKTTKHIQLDSSSDDIIPWIQAVLNRFPEDGWPKILNKDDSLLFASRDDAEKFLWGEKQAMVAVGKAVNASPVQIARVANLDINTAETILAARGAKLPFDESLPIARYSDNNQAKYYNQKSIQLEGKIGSYGQIEEMAIKSMHDKDTLVNMDMAISKNILETSGVPKLTSFMDKVLYTPITKAMRDQIHKALAAVENRWTTVTSADHGMRELGKLGEWASAYGHDMGKAANAHIEEIKLALQPTLSSVAEHTASRYQFSLVRQALHAIPIESAAKIKYDPAVGKIITEVIDNIPSYLTQYGTANEITLTPQMQKFMAAWLPKQQELLAVHNAKRQLVGLPKSQGAGVWFPYSELNKEMVAFKVPKKGQPGQVELITASNAKDLGEYIIEAQKLHGSTHNIISKADSAAWTQINRYSDLEQYKVADISLTKTGITSGTITPGITDITNFYGSIQRDMLNSYRRIARSANSSIFDELDFIARRRTAASGGGKGSLAQQVQRRVSMPELVSKTMLNESMVHDTPMLDMANNWTTVVINTVLDNADKAVKGVRGKSLGDTYSDVTKAMKEMGMDMPYPDEATLASAMKKANVPDTALHRVQQGQSIMVRLNLRLLEASHAAVTVTSLPVILQGELAHVTGRGGVAPLKHMIDAGKFWGGVSDEAVKLKDYAKEMKYTSSIVAETTEAMKDFHISDKVFGKYEKILDKLSTPSDWAEGWVREQAFANGYLLAKAKSPNAPMKLLAAEAYAFTNRVMGNYVPRQRPTMFQGTFGAMIGLYQTFMLTMGQNMFRYLEAGDSKALRNLWGAQGAMFGIESLPMFQQFNHLLGGYVSDEHEDFRSAVYGAFGDDSDQSYSAAEHILFGVPSAMFGTGLYTRGALDPRSPLTATTQAGLSFKPAIYDAATQAGELVVNLAKAMGSDDRGRAILQGFAAQSLWRPGARYAEMALGSSFDQKGEVIDPTVDSPLDVALGRADEPFAVFSRVLGARPLKEQALRNLRFSNSYYNTIDKDRRAKYTKELRRIVTSEPDPTKIDELFIDFTSSPGGTYRGWRQIYNDAYSASEIEYANRLVSDVKRQPTIQRIVDTYAQ